MISIIITEKAGNKIPKPVVPELCFGYKKICNNIRVLETGFFSSFGIFRLVNANHTPDNSLTVMSH